MRTMCENGRNTGFGAREERGNHVSWVSRNNRRTWERRYKKMKKVSFCDTEFRKSSVSQYTWNVCVMVAIRDDVVGARDSKDWDKTTLQFTRQEWKAFIEGVKRSEFDV